jgi:L-arabonate dehydrase
VKRGIFEGRRLPGGVPGLLNGESNLRPTAMFTRNLASMDVEESIRGNPIDAVVLLVGCDKTTPALLMGAASCDVPAIVVTGGPMLNGKHTGKDIGSGTAVWQLSEQVKAGKISLHEFMSAEAGMSRSAGTCNTMGTASTMACMAEALGVLPHNAAIPAVDARRYVLAHMSGMRIVEMARRACAVEDPHARSVRERDPRERGDRRLDQCGDPPEGDRRAHRREPRTRRLDSRRPRHADARRPACRRAAS